MHLTVVVRKTLPRQRAQRLTAIMHDLRARPTPACPHFVRRQITDHMSKSYFIVPRSALRLMCAGGRAFTPLDSPQIQDGELHATDPQADSAASTAAHSQPTCLS